MQPSSSWRPWIVLGCASFFYAYQFLLRVSPSVMTEELMGVLAVDASSLGFLLALYYNSYATLQIPAGIVLDRVGPRRVLFGALFLCISGAFLFSLALSSWFVGCGRLLIGAGSAFGFLSCIKVGTLWFPPSRLAFAMGVSMVIGTFGATLGGGPLALVVAAVGWQTTCYLCVALGFFLVLLVWLFVEDAPKNTFDSASTGPVENTTSVSSGSPQTSSANASSAPGDSGGILSLVWGNLKTVASNPQTWWVGFYGLLIYVPLSAFADMWGVGFLMRVYGVDKNLAARIISFVYVGMASGSLLVPVLCDKVQSYRLSLYVGSFASTVLFAGIVLYPLFFSVEMLYGVFFSLGVFLSTQTMAFVVIADINPSHLAATAGGFHNMICMISGIIFQPLIGFFLNHEGLPLPEYLKAFYVIPLATLGALFLAAFTRDTYPQEKKAPR